MEILFFVDHRSFQEVVQSKTLGKAIHTTRARLALTSILEFPSCRIIFVSNKNNLIRLADGLSRDLSLKLGQINSDETLANDFLQSNNISIKPKNTSEINLTLLRQELKI